MKIEKWKAATQWFIVEHRDGAGMEITGCDTTPAELMKHWVLYLYPNPELYDRNSVYSITRWVYTMAGQCADQDHHEEANLVIQVGLPMAKHGGWRGTTSEALANLGLDPDRKLGLDLYL